MKRLNYSACSPTNSFLICPYFKLFQACQVWCQTMASSTTKQRKSSNKTTASSTASSKDVSSKDKKTPESTIQQADHLVNRQSKNQYWMLVGILVALAAFILSPQLQDKVISVSQLSMEDPNAPHVRVTIVRAGMDDEPNSTTIGKRFISQKSFADLVYNNKGRFFDPSTGIQIKTWGQLTRWVSSDESKELGGDAPYIYFDPGVKKSSFVSMLLNKVGGEEKETLSSDYDELFVRSGDGGVPFIWPPLRVGHRVVRRDINPPRGSDHPITLETVNLSPKVCGHLLFRCGPRFLQVFFRCVLVSLSLFLLCIYF
jgi:hypothetical protein